MSKDPYIPLRWYELKLLEFLVRSPRINRIVVEQILPEDDELEDDRHEASLREQLEMLYLGPCADDAREG